MTAADRPSVTDNARAEAERRWPEWENDEYHEGHVNGWMAHAEWAAGRAETTTTPTATTEDAAWDIIAKVRDAYPRVPNDAPTDDLVEALAAADLLATARTRPTRDAIEEAIEAGKVAHDDAVAAGGAVGPQNDYIAEEVEALLDHDQPTEAEAGARALVHAAGDHFHAMVAAGAGNPSEVSTWLRERAARLRGGDQS